MAEQSGHAFDQAWLTWPELPEGTKGTYRQPWMTRVIASSKTDMGQTASRELQRGLERLFGVNIEILDQIDQGESGVWLGTLANFRLESMARDISVEQMADLEGMGEEAYAICPLGPGVAVVGVSDRGLLYGAFSLIRQMATLTSLQDMVGQNAPANPLRMLNHWDNLDGSVERGYAGGSLFFSQGQVLPPSSRLTAYARLLASVGINAVAINNVNVHGEESYFITPKHLADLAALAERFRGYAIRLFLSVNFASPVEIGGLSTADPLDEAVQAWWQEQAALIYSYIPDFGGFVVKADSEFRPGPFTYGRDHADGANLLARALAPYGGLVIWRCFVYDCQTDWRNRKLDRARAAFDHFVKLDGRFDDHVVLQIKNGPIDFQVREPVSPLLGAMAHTNQMLELQITQEYTGQQRDLCYLVPQWKEVLDFDTYAKGPSSTIAEVASGKGLDRRLGGIAGVANAGNDPYWTGHPLAQANFYGFGRLAWDPKLASAQITAEWIHQTLGHAPLLVDVLSSMLHDSWPIYESYTAPLGVGFMVNPGHHYGPNVDGYEYSKWGTYHFADHQGIGVDRTEATGTGYVGQYREPHRSIYEDVQSCPDELLLFFHHVAYGHRLGSGKTVIQHIYDSHFEGAEAARGLLARWQQISREVPAQWAERVAERLAWQVQNAEEWRDVVNTYFYRKTGIGDERGRFIVP